MRMILGIILLALAGCSPGPVTFQSPPKNAPEWDLNVGRWPGTNALAQIPPGSH